MISTILALCLLAALPDEIAAALYNDGHYPAAAGAFETSWLTDADPVALAWAGRSRLRAGHAAHAATYLARALVGRLPDDLRDLATTDLAAARARTHTTPVQLELHAPPGRLTVVARRGGVDAPALYHELTAPPGAAVHVLLLALDPGPWTLELRRGGELRVRRNVDVQANQPPIRLAERPFVPPPAPPSRRPRVVLAGGLTGGALALFGVGLVVHANAQIAMTAAVCPLHSCDLGPTRLTRMRAAGAGLLGAGVGLVAASLPAISPLYTRCRNLWAGELALGAVAFSIGLGVAGVNGARYNDPTLTTAETRLQLGDFHTTGVAFMGLGAGLATTAIASLIADAVTRRRDLRAALTPTLTGVALTGRF